MKTATAQLYRVLLADDQADIRDALRLLLKREGYETQAVASPAEALSAIESREFDAVLMDLNYTRDTTSGQEGLDLLTNIEVLDRTLPVLELIGRIGPSDANVLITGEHGTGKEVVARTLHALSNRTSKPMVTVNAGGLSEGVFESELFGHVKGAFTDARSDRVGRFELADNSTLFLDEIANVPLNLQAKLLQIGRASCRERVGSSTTRRVNVRV